MYLPIKENSFNHLIMTLGNWHIMKYTFKFLYKSSPIFKELWFQIFKIDQKFTPKLKTLTQFFTILDIASLSLVQSFEDLSYIIESTPESSDIHVEAKFIKFVFLTLIPLVCFLKFILTIMKTRDFAYVIHTNNNFEQYKLTLYKISSFFLA